MQMEVSNGMPPLGFGGSSYEQEHEIMHSMHHPTADTDELDDSSDNNVNNISNAARYYNDQVLRYLNTHFLHNNSFVLPLLDGKW